LDPKLYNRNVVTKKPRFDSRPEVVALAKAGQPVSRTVVLRNGNAMNISNSNNSQSTQDNRENISIRGSDPQVSRTNAPPVAAAAAPPRPEFIHYCASKTNHVTGRTSQSSSSSLSSTLGESSTSFSALSLVPSQESLTAHSFPFTLDKWQRAAIHLVETGAHVLLTAHTGSGR
jgi:superfamily II RNA helicase